MMDTISPENMGFAVSAYLFMTTISGMVSTFILGWIQNYFHADLQPELYGTTLAGFMLFSYLGCVPAFWIAGKRYS